MPTPRPLPDDHMSRRYGEGTALKGRAVYSPLPDDHHNQEYGEGTATSHSVHPHGDGSFHTISSEGVKTHHPSFGHMVAHLAMHHSPDDHYHVHGHEDGYTTHHVVDGKMHGPNEHERISQVKSHMQEAMEQED